MQFKSSNCTTATPSWVILRHRGRPVPCGMWGSIPALCPLDVSSTTTPNVGRSQEVSRHYRMSPCGQNHSTLTTVALEALGSGDCPLKTNGFPFST